MIKQIIKSWMILENLVRFDILEVVSVKVSSGQSDNF